MPYVFTIQELAEMLATKQLNRAGKKSLRGANYQPRYRKISFRIAQHIRRVYKRGNGPKLAAKYGVTQKTIYDIVAGRHWSPEKYGRAKARA